MNIQAKRYNTFWKLKIVNAQILKLVIPPERSDRTMYLLH